MRKTRLRSAAAKAGISSAVLFVVSVALFASLNASRTRPAPLANTRSSPEALAAAVIGAMRAGDLQQLQMLALTEDEFRAHVWPDLPASRPERNIPFDFVWNTLQQNSHAYLRQTLARLDESAGKVREVRFAGATSGYGDVTVRRRSEIVIAGEDGNEQVVRLFGSMIEQDGRFKVFSYVVND